MYHDSKCTIILLEIKTQLLQTGHKGQLHFLPRSPLNSLLSPLLLPFFCPFALAHVLWIASDSLINMPIQIMHGPWALGIEREDIGAGGAGGAGGFVSSIEEDKG